VSQWLKAARDGGGASALRARKHAGPARKLDDAERAAVLHVLTWGAEFHGFRGDLWTCARVAEVIERVCGVSYHPAHVSRLLREWGWSPQKPTRRATQRDEAAIKRWRERDWPALKKERSSSAERSSS
jgi:transposase